MQEDTVNAAKSFLDLVITKWGEAYLAPFGYMITARMVAGTGVYMPILWVQGGKGSEREAFVRLMFNMGARSVGSPGSAASIWRNVGSCGIPVVFDDYETGSSSKDNALRTASMGLAGKTDDPNNSQQFLGGGIIVCSEELPPESLKKHCLLFRMEGVVETSPELRARGAGLGNCLSGETFSLPQDLMRRTWASMIGFVIGSLGFGGRSWGYEVHHHEVEIEVEDSGPAEESAAAYEIGIDSAKESHQALRLAETLKNWRDGGPAADVSIDDNPKVTPSDESRIDVTELNPNGDEKLIREAIVHLAAELGSKDPAAMADRILGDLEEMKERKLKGHRVALDLHPKIAYTPLYYIQKVEEIWGQAWRRELGPDAVLAPQEQLDLHKIRSHAAEALKNGGGEEEAPEVQFVASKEAPAAYTAVEGGEGRSGRDSRRSSRAFDYPVSKDLELQSFGKPTEMAEGMDEALAAHAQGAKGRALVETINGSWDVDSAFGEGSALNLARAILGRFDITPKTPSPISDDG